MFLSCHAGDPYQIFGYDFLHNWSLGVLQTVIGGIKAYADRVGKPGSRHCGSKALKRLDERLLRMPRCEGFRLPTWRKYFSDPANITASEHMAVQQASHGPGQGAALFAINSSGALGFHNLFCSNHLNRNQHLTRDFRDG